MTETTTHYDGAWLVRAVHADPAAVRQVKPVLFTPCRDTSNALRARRSLEGLLGVASGHRIAGEAYAQAARALAAEGQAEAAAVLTLIAVTSPVLAQAEKHWQHRYDRSPLLQLPGPVLAMVTTRQVQWTGGVYSAIDGALCMKAEFYSRSGRDPVPAVTVTTDVPSTELVTFSSHEARDEWLADRAQGLPGVPLNSVHGPDCRTVLEERVLARLLRLPYGAADPWPELAEDMFTTDSRAEILLAWRDLAARGDRRDDWLVEAELASRLLFAPAWADPSVGRGGATASMYLYRLARTEVTSDVAESAAARLLEQDRSLGGRPVETVELPPPRLSPEDTGPLPEP